MNLTNSTKLLKKYIVRICCCSGCLKQATYVFGFIDIGLAALTILVTVIFLYSYDLETDLDLFDNISANSVKGTNDLETDLDLFDKISVNRVKDVILDITIVIQSCNIVACILLFYGNQSERRRNYLCPYVIMGFIRLLGIFMTIILLIFIKQWQLILNCLCAMTYAICSLHVIGERDKELLNQLASKLKSLETSTSTVSNTKDMNIDIFTIKEQEKSISLKESRRYVNSPKFGTHHLTKNNREDVKTKDYKPSQSTLSISSTIFPSLEVVSDNSKLSHPPLSTQVSRSTLLTKSESSKRPKSSILMRPKLLPLKRPKSSSHRPNSSISLTSLNEATILDPNDLLLSKSVDPLLRESESTMFLSQSTLLGSISPSRLPGTIDTNIAKSTKCCIENCCRLNYELCQKLEMNVLNGSSCKLCQLCPSSYVTKENIYICDFKNKCNFAKQFRGNNILRSTSCLQVPISQNSKISNQTSMSTSYIVAQIENNKDKRYASEGLPSWHEKASAHNSSVKENGLQIRLDKEPSSIQSPSEIYDKETNAYRFSQILLGKYDKDDAIIDC